MTYDESPSEEVEQDRLVKRVLIRDSERFPTPGVRVWRALAYRLSFEAQAVGRNNGVAQSKQKARGWNGSDVAHAECRGGQEVLQQDE